MDFENIGAYAHVARTHFNGFLYPHDYYYIRDSDDRLRYFVWKSFLYRSVSPVFYGSIFSASLSEDALEPGHS